MEIELLKTVQKLHSRLKEDSEPRKLLKTFRKLRELPVTVEILAETGVGRTVNSLRKHDAVGDAAKTLVTEWKQLVRRASHSEKSTSQEKRKREESDGLKRGLKRKRAEETPTMSCLTPDAPQPAKKKPSHPLSSSSHRKIMSPPAAAAAAAATAATTGTLPVLHETSLGAPVSNSRPLLSTDVSVSPQRCEVPEHDEEESFCFTGMRVNSRTAVYSGKTTHPPRMSVDEQHIRTQQNNIDSIGDVGAVPYHIMEQVLERCTPEQLYRIEQFNPRFTQDSNQLWMRHCQCHFKQATPREPESWRDMYMRLHNEREERLKNLTSRISMSHANKPKGRQVKLMDVEPIATPRFTFAAGCRSLARRPPPPQLLLPPRSQT